MCGRNRAVMVVTAPPVEAVSQPNPILPPPSSHGVYRTGFTARLPVLCAD